MAKNSDLLEVEGIIVDVLPNQMFKVKIHNEHIITCYTGGKMRQFRIRLILGDKVRVEVIDFANLLVLDNLAF